MPLRFRKVLISDEIFESAAVFDVDGDGVLDIVSGAWWYKGPDFTERFHIAEVRQDWDFFDDLSNIPMDINGNGRTDYVTGGWHGKTLRWHENPGAPWTEWPVHTIADTGFLEATGAWDVDGDGHIEVVPNTPRDPLVVYKLARDKRGKGKGYFDAFRIWDRPQKHGLGWGDLTGNGRGDFVTTFGWLECPENPLTGEWVFHDDFDLSFGVQYGSASFPILVTDVNGDGVNDLIVGQGHTYGLHWIEHRIEGKKHTWTPHPIDPFNSQYHDLRWVDIDGDGEMELVTGKRYRSHRDNDLGAHDPYGLYYFKWTGEGFAKQVIDYGEKRDTTGTGIQMAIVDLTGNGLPDIVAPGKDGLYVFYNLGEAPHWEVQWQWEQEKKRGEKT